MGDSQLSQLPIQKSSLHYNTVSNSDGLGSSDFPQTGTDGTDLVD